MHSWRLLRELNLEEVSPFCLLTSRLRLIWLLSGQRFHWGWGSRRIKCSGLVLTPWTPWVTLERQIAFSGLHCSCVINRINKSSSCSRTNMSCSIRSWVWGLFKKIKTIKSYEASLFVCIVYTLHYTCVLLFCGSPNPYPGKINFWGPKGWLWSPMAGWSHLSFTDFLLYSSSLLARWGRHSAPHYLSPQNGKPWGLRTCNKVSAPSEGSLLSLKASEMLPSEPNLLLFRWSRREKLTIGSILEDREEDVGHGGTHFPPSSLGGWSSDIETLSPSWTIRWLREILDEDKSINHERSENVAHCLV